MTSEAAGTDPTDFWYDDPAVTVTLHAVRRFRRADQEMRRRMAAQMGMNVSDLQALQFVIAAELHGTVATPKDLSRDLGISTASTTKMLDRLTASGHLERRPHPSDRRALVLHATDHAHREVRDRLTGMHEEMGGIARAVPAGARAALVTFLDAMAECFDTAGEVERLTPAPGRE